MKSLMTRRIFAKLSAAAVGTVIAPALRAGDIAARAVTGTTPTSVGDRVMRSRQRLRRATGSNRNSCST